MYQGGVGMWAFILHRVTGLGVLLFLVVHILETALLGFGPDVYNRAIKVYQQAWFRPFEVLLFAAVLFHAVNGIRIIIVDFFPQLGRFQQGMFWGAAGVFALVFFPAAYLMMR